MKPTLEQIQVVKSELAECKLWRENMSEEAEEAIKYALTLAEQVAKGEVVVLPKELAQDLEPVIYDACLEYERQGIVYKAFDKYHKPFVKTTTTTPTGGRR